MAHSVRMECIVKARAESGRLGRRSGVSPYLELSSLRISKPIWWGGLVLALALRAGRPLHACHV